MPDISVHIDTSQVLAFGTKLQAAAATAPARARVGVRSTAGAVEAAMKAGAPRLTGKLADSITTTISGTRAEIGPDTDYDEYVEDGTSVMAPEPFVGPAFDQHAPELETALARVGLGGL